MTTHLHYNPIYTTHKKAFLQHLYGELYDNMLHATLICVSAIYKPGL